MRRSTRGGKMKQRGNLVILGRPLASGGCVLVCGGSGSTETSGRSVAGQPPLPDVRTPRDTARLHLVGQALHRWQLELLLQSAAGVAGPDRRSGSPIAEAVRRRLTFHESKHFFYELLAGKELEIVVVGARDQHKLRIAT
jgi:hypothetical protein